MHSVNTSTAITPNRSGLGPSFNVPRRWSAIPALLLLGTVAACSPENGEAAATMKVSAPPPPSVTVANVVEREVTDTASYVGRTAAVQRVELVSRVQGVLEKLDVKEGSEVVAGQLLFEIEPAKYQANQAVAAASVATAEAAYEKARKYRNRLRAVKAGGVSANAMEDATNALAQATAQWDQSKAQLQLADLELSYTRILAPISGRIGSVPVHVGNLVGPETGVLATIVQLDPVRVTFGVSERVATNLLQSRLAQGLSRPEMSWFTPRLTLSNGAAYPHVGALDFVDNELNALTGSLQVRATFPNPQRLIRPGQFVSVQVQRGAVQQLPVVPQSSVQQDQSGYYVLTVNSDGVVEQRRVTLGDRLGIDWVVESGVAVGEQVIYQGLQKVRPGAKVNAQLADPHAGLKSSAAATKKG